MARLAWVASAPVSEPGFRSEPSYRRSLHPATPRTVGTSGQAVSHAPEFNRRPTHECGNCRGAEVATQAQTF